METVAILVGILFGLMQLRQIRIQNEVQSGAELLRSMQSHDLASLGVIIFRLPDDLSGEELKSRLGEKFDSAIGLAALVESMGPLVARGHVPIEMYEEYFSGFTVIFWRKVRHYAEEERAAGWTNLFEWVQWLAERMEERAPLSDDSPAFERFRDWRTAADYRRLRA